MQLSPLAAATVLTLIAAACTAKENPMSAQSLQKQIDAAAVGAVVDVPAGRIEGTWVIPRAMTLRGAGAGETTLDGGGRGPTLAVDASEADVRIEGLTITGGSGRVGGGISIDNRARVTVVACRVVNNRSTGRGGGVGLDTGSLRLEQTDVVDNQAKEGAGIYVGVEASAQIIGGSVTGNEAERGGGVAVLEGASLRVEGTRFAKNQAKKGGHHLLARGRPGVKPEIVLVKVDLVSTGAGNPDVLNDLKLPAHLVARDTPWPSNSGKAPPTE
jgi:hypothetical protein